jgi:hypothetical protein
MHLRLPPAGPYNLIPRGDHDLMTGFFSKIGFLRTPSATNLWGLCAESWIGRTRFGLGFEA